VPAKSRIAVRLYDERAQFMDPDRPRLLCSPSIDGFQQVHIECAAQGQPFRKDRGSRKHCAMSSLFRLEQWNLQPRFLERYILKPIEVLDLLVYSFLQDRVCQSEKAAAWPDFVGLASFGRALTC